MGRTVARCVFVITPALAAAAVVSLLMMGGYADRKTQWLITLVVFLFVFKAGWDLTADRYGR